MALIEVTNVTKLFRMHRGTRVLVGRGGLADWLHGRKREMFAALKNVNFHVEPGESVGIIGRNGSGKSTLLKIIAGVTVPTSGGITVRGRVASLLELGAGFHPMLTGRENIYLNGNLIGMRRSQIDAVFDDIVSFSGIGEFIDNPVDTYSSGMFVRLGFAVAVHSDPDVFLVDEVLSVGDEEFQRRCQQRISELMALGKTIVFVSHDLNIVNTICRRVVLMQHGEMLVRDTPQSTIDFYLRQIGSEQGIHNFSNEPIEAIACHGRLSMFYERRETTAPSGFLAAVRCMEQLHYSTSATWAIEQRHSAGCLMLGRMPRVPITHIWTLRIENGRLFWDIAIECSQDAPIQMLEIQMQFPARYTQWINGDFNGTFPDILPSDLEWSLVAPAQHGYHEAAIYGEEACELPPLLIHVHAHNPYVSLQWFNTDYMASARALTVACRIPEAEWPLKAGRHELMSIEVRPAENHAEVRDWAHNREAQRHLILGALQARYYRGAIQLMYAGETLTAFLGFYASMLIGGLWNDSTALKWNAATRTGDCIEATGESRRFPFRQHWRIEITPEGLAVSIELEALEPLDVEEYHACICLRPEYEHWRTEHESGAYPDFDPDSEDWRHANRLYAPGRFGAALSSTYPRVTMASVADAIPFRFTAINSGYMQHARVLEALRTPDAGCIHFEPGRRLYFAGLINVGEPDPPTNG